MYFRKYITRDERFYGFYIWRAEGNPWSLDIYFGRNVLVFGAKKKY